MKISRSIFRKFVKNEDGNLSMILGLAAVPMLLAAGVAIDEGRINKTKEEMQAVADGAALAGAATKGSVTLRTDVALKFVQAHADFGYGATITPVVTADDKSATITLTGQIQGTLTNIAFAAQSGSSGNTSVPVKAKAVNSVVPGQSICVFSTSEHDNKAIYLYGTGAFTANGCTLRANSDASDAITVQGNKSVTTDGMYALGGYSKIGGAGSVIGAFTTIEEILADPYDFIVDTSALGSDLNSTASVSLSAQRYRNITIKKGTATFTPGVHYVTGKLTVQAQGKLFGDGVTIVLVGKDAYLDIQAGGVIDIKAPRADQLVAAEKQYAGFAVVGYTNAAGDLANNDNIFLGGASSNIRGIVYTPNQNLKISGNSDFNVDSKYSPLIANKIELGGNGAVTIGLDYAAYGFAKPEPLFIAERTDVRLVQ